MIDVILGLQLGDCGKGKIIDYLTSSGSHTVARFNGGPNAGHTIFVNGKKTVLHAIPSGILNPRNTNVIGSSCVLDLKKISKEIEELKEAGVDVSPSNFYISDRAHIILPIHIALDKAREADRGKDKIGTTSCGIGPCYEDKSSRNGLRIMDLQLSYAEVSRKVKKILLEKNALISLYDSSLCQDLSEQMEYLTKYGAFVLEHSLITDLGSFCFDDLVIEGAQGSMLDLENGVYPYVSSSTATLGGTFNSLSITPDSEKINVYGVIKPYLTSVSGAPMPTEALDEYGEHLSRVGKEFGATTGRRRRCGWIDLVMLKYAIKLNGVYEIALLKLDVLTGLPKIKACTEYNLNGVKSDSFPSNVEVLRNCKPNYVEFEGWTEDITGLTNFEDLPRNAKNYVMFLERHLGVNIRYVGTGPNRSDLIVRV